MDVLARKLIRFLETGFETHKADVDPAPLFRAADDQCQCPQGVVLISRIIFRYADRRVFTAGDAPYGAPGLPLIFAGTELVEFGP